MVWWVWVEEVDWLTQSPDFVSSTFGMSWNKDCEPLIQHQHMCSAEWMVTNSHWNTLRSYRKSSKKSGSCWIWKSKILYFHKVRELNSHMEMQLLCYFCIPEVVQKCICVSDILQHFHSKTFYRGFIVKWQFNSNAKCLNVLGILDSNMLTGTKS